MQSTVKLKLCTKCNGDSFDIYIDEIQAKVSYDNDNKYSNFTIAPGSYVLTTEEFKPYKAKFWWLWVLTRFAAGSMIRTGTLGFPSTAYPQYLLFKGLITIRHDAIIKYEKSEGKLVLESKSLEIKETFNAEYFDIKYKRKVMLSCIIPMVLLFVLFGTLFLLLLLYSIRIGSIFGMTLFSILLPACVITAVVQFRKIMKFTEYICTTYYCNIF